MSSPSSLSDGIIEGIKNRINHPIVGTYLISFLIINWELTYSLACGGDNFKETIANVKLEACQHPWFTFGMPAFFVLLFVLASEFVFPFIQLVFDKYHRYIDRKNEANKIRESTNETPVRKADLTATQEKLAIADKKITELTTQMKATYRKLKETDYERTISEQFNIFNGKAVLEKVKEAQNELEKAGIRG